MSQKAIVLSRLERAAGAWVMVPIAAGLFSLWIAYRYQAMNIYSFMTLWVYAVFTSFILIFISTLIPELCLSRRWMLLKVVIGTLAIFAARCVIDGPEALTFSIERETPNLSFIWVRPQSLLGFLLLYFVLDYAFQFVLSLKSSPTENESR